MGVRHIYPVNMKDHYHLKVVEQEGAADCIKWNYYWWNTNDINSQNWGENKHGNIPEELQINTKSLNQLPKSNFKKILNFFLLGLPDCYRFGSV